MLDRNVGLGLALSLASLAVVGIGAPVLAAQGFVAAVTMDGITGAADTQPLHQTHRIERTVLLTLLWKKGTGWGGWARGQEQ